MRRVGEDDGKPFEVLLVGVAQLGEPSILSVVHLDLRGLHLLSLDPESQVAQVEHHFVEGKLHPAKYTTRYKWNWPPAAAFVQRDHGDEAMAKESRSAAKDVKGAMHKRKAGTLKSGRSGKAVKSKKQAIAIGLSEARKKGKKVPARKKAS